jgi:hypothetical protein
MEIDALLEIIKEQKIKVSLYLISSEDGLAGVLY